MSVPDCRYCEAEFDDEDAYLDHLVADHADDLGTIDQRRVAGRTDDNSGLDVPTGPLVIGLVVLGGVAVIVAAWVTTTGGGGSTGSVDAAVQPTDLRTVHYHGTIEVVIAGDQVDFSRDRYQLQSEAFHFEGGGGTRWHVHARQVTLEYAMATLDIDVTTDTVTYDGTTYRDADSGTDVTVAVNGESVQPSEYVLQEGDRITVRIEQ
ncbi:C2H2-type zinc finger protein [Halobacterium rubrum]|uniref:C2H2-type zinc finger protein n=1 Tax=Halobacterium TaxID=2239 RepID=UPI001F3F9AEB|nr:MULTISPECIES: C2H2-type zinc finger protein [Halobacterium]MDH5020303.1 hypothetical protein [Halobacterium rubrum]